MNTRKVLNLLHGNWSILLATVLILAIVAPAVYGDAARPQHDDPIRAVWGATDFQAINLAPDSQPFTAHFISPAGEDVYTVDNVIPGGGSYVYNPLDNLPAGFSGTLVLETPIRAAMGVVHLDELLEFDGNTIFAGVADEDLGQTAYVPIDRCVYLHIHNLDPISNTLVALRAYQLDGSMAPSSWLDIPPWGAVVVYPVSNMGLPLDFVGLGVLQANHLIEVTVRNVCGGFSAYVSPQVGSTTLLAPRVPPSGVLMTTTIFIHNTVMTPTLAEIHYTSGLTESFSLPPLGGVVRGSPFTDTTGAAVIVAGQPLVAEVRTINRRPNSEGAFVYSAVALERATRAVALPVLFAGYENWETEDLIWIRNVADVSNTVRIRYVTAPTGTVFWDEVEVGPKAIQQVVMPELPAERAAAILLAEQPIVVVAGADYSILGRQIRDRQIRYHGTNFVFDYDLVSDADFAWAPTAPTILRPLLFTATAFAGVSGTVQVVEQAPTPPISYTWDFGDGILGSGEFIQHFYEQAGSYTVTLTATNYLGFGSARSTDQVTVAPAPWSIYLPLVVRLVFF